jgi:hypothetical protein
MSRGFRRAMLIPLAILIAFVCYYPYSAAGRQRHNMAIARNHLPKIEAIVAANQRYRFVRTGVYTGQDGAIWLVGDVESENDVCELMKAVANERLPIATRFDLQIRPPRDR